MVTSIDLYLIFCIMYMCPTIHFDWEGGKEAGRKRRMEEAFYSLAGKPEWIIKDSSVTRGVETIWI